MNLSELSRVDKKLFSRELSSSENTPCLKIFIVNNKR